MARGIFSGRIYGHSISIIPILVAVFIITLICRLKGVELLNLNYDEGLFGYVAYNLYSYSNLIYTPDMHGPMLYGLTWISFRFFGVSDFSARMFQILLGSSTILMLYFLRCHLGGNIHTVAAALLFAISPVFFIFSRELRPDILLVFFVLIMLICILKYSKEQRDIYLLLFTVSLGLCLITKENVYIVLAIFILYFLLGEMLSCRSGKSSFYTNLRNKLISYFDHIISKSRLLVLCAVLLSALYILSYSYLFLYPELPFLFLSDVITYWFGRSHFNVAVPYTPYPSYLLIIIGLIRWEFIATVFGLGGACYYTFMRRDRFMMFLSFWAVASIIIYSIPTYKLAHFMLYILLPLMLIAGRFIGDIAVYIANGWSKDGFGSTGRLLSVLFVVFLLYSGFTSYSFSYNNHNNLEILEPHDAYKGYELIHKYLAEPNDSARQTKSSILSSISETVVEYENIFIFPAGDGLGVGAYSPMFWYLRDYDHNIKIVGSYTSYLPDYYYFMPHISEVEFRDKIGNGNSAVIIPYDVSMLSGLDAYLVSSGCGVRVFTVPINGIVDNMKYLAVYRKV